jgi:hypothetical protein
MKTIKLLTIGNSFSNNALTYLNDLAASTSEVSFEIGRASLGGCSLERHWNLACYTEMHPEYKTYNIGTREDGTAHEASLQDALTAAQWDYVTLQQFSGYSWQRGTFDPYLGKLHALVRERAPQAKIMLHQTWAYRSDSPFYPQNGLTQELMFERIGDTYAHYAAELGCGVLPSGEAIQKFRRTPGRQFEWPDPEYDYQHAEAPALPRQENSLAVGWHWVISGSWNGIPELRLDANHLNATGCYLAGCVWYECLTGRDVRQATFRPEDIDAGTAEFLRGIAHEVAGAAGTVSSVELG